MLLRKMNLTLSGAAELTKYLLVSNVALAIGLALAVGKLVSDHEVTRLVPPYLETEATVGWNTADKAYLEGIGLYVADLIGNITPKNAAFVADRASEILTPRIYKSARAQILALADDPVFSTSGGSVRFQAMKVESEADAQKVFVIGQFISDQIGSHQVKPVVIEMKIIVRDGRPWVDSLDQYSGMQPHTAKWLAENQSRAQQIQQQQQAAAVTATSDAEAALAAKASDASPDVDSADQTQPEPSAASAPAAHLMTSSVSLPPPATAQTVMEKKQ